MSSHDGLTFASSCGAGVVHYARCWSCQTLQHPGGWHGWAYVTDVEHALATGQADPSGSKCGCACADGPVLDLPDVEEVQVSMEAIEYDMAPCGVCQATGACGFDTDDEPWIHVPREDHS